MTVNQDLFQKIHDQIAAHPELHFQGDWEGGNECGTTYCVGGWAIVLTTGSNRPLRVQAEAAGHAHMSGYAQKLLGLDAEGAWHLFYNTEDSEAETIVREFADLGESPELARLIEANDPYEEIA